jgi:RNA polymerase sigma-70 factor (ECF subfamily)
MRKPAEERSPARPHTASPAPRAEIDQLMARLAEGDRAVFQRVFTELWGPVSRLCRHLLAHEADAADAAQEAMHKILQRASDYDPARPALPWALAIAAWECRTLMRKRARRREVSVQTLPEPVARDAEADLASRNLTRAALAALGELSALDRETLIASFWDEAASASGATQRKRRERALSRLRSTFRRLYGLD